MSKKTGADIRIERLFVTFSGDLFLEKLYVGNAEGDTILYSGSLEMGVGFKPFIQDGDIHLTKLQWSDVVVRIKRSEDSEAFNFDFLLSPFLGEGESEVSLEQGQESSDFPKIKLPIINFQRVDIRYTDAWLGIAANLDWEIFLLEAQTVDLNQMNFDMSTFLLSNANIRYTQTKPFPPTETNEESSNLPLPLLALGSGNLQGVSLFYESKPDGILADAFIGKFTIELPEADLENQKVLVKNMLLEDSQIRVGLTTDESLASTDAEKEFETGFKWPDWTVHLHYLGVLNSDFNYNLNESQVKKGYFNPEAIGVNELTLETRAVTLEQGKLALKVDDFRFEEASGFVLKEFNLGFALSDQELIISDATIQTNDSKVQTDLKFTFASLQDWIEEPLSMAFLVDIRELSTNFREVVLFEPSVSNEDWYRQIKGKSFRLNTKVAGDDRSVSLNRFAASFDRSLKFTMDKGLFSNYLDVDRIALDIKKAKLQGDKRVVAGWLTDDLIEFVPAQYTLELQGKGGLKEFDGQVNLLSSLGDIAMNLTLKEEDFLVISSTIQTSKLQVGEILDIPELEPISLSLAIDARVKDVYNSYGKLNLGFEQLQWNGIDFSALVFEASLEQQLAELSLIHSKDFLNLDIQVQAKVDTLQPEATLQLDLKNIDTQYLGFTKKPVETQLKSTGNFVFDERSFVGELLVTDAFMRLTGQRSIPMGDIRLNMSTKETESSLVLVSDFLNGNMSANHSFEHLINSVTNYLNEQITEEKPSLHERGKLQAEAAFVFQSTPFIDQLLISNVERIESIQLDFSFDEELSKFIGSLQVPSIYYSGLGIDSLMVNILGTSEDISLQLSFQSLDTGPVAMGETIFSGKLKNQQIFTEFQSMQEEELVIYVNSKAYWERDTLVFKIIPDKLILNKRGWDIPDRNAIRYAPGYLIFDDFELTRATQRFSITNHLEGITEAHVALVVDNFDVNTITSFLNPDEPFLNGKANGRIVIERPLSDLGFLADFSISDLVAFDVPLGTLRLDGDSQNLKEYVFGLRLNEGMIDAVITGQLVADSVASQLDISLELQSLDLKLLEILSSGEITTTSGFVAGSLNVSGDTDDLVYSGYLQLKEGFMKVTALNADFEFPNERIEISEDYLAFDDFTVKDGLGTNFIINGKILTGDFSNVVFDLALKTQKFQLLNSTRADNELFFGKASIDLDMKVTGPLSLPRIDVLFVMNKGSEITFIVPEDQLELQERDGVVLMVNKKDPYDMFYQRELDQYTQGAQGFDVRANIKIDPNFVFNLIVDERTGDNLKLQGEADLNMLMDPNGNISLSGKYEVKQGHYELNLFGLVNRRFLLAEGSSVTWTGDPLDANLDLTAIYNVKTSAAELMQAQLSGTDNSTRGQFRQVLPFMVYLSIDGELMSPKISFQLDMPENERGVFGGNVYAAVNQLNEKEDELTKQVFALLVLNQFFPSMGNDGSTGGSVNLARSSVSQVLSTQLNALSDKLFGNSGFSLDFDLDSFTDYQNGGPQDRTQLNVAAKQSLMDDRLVISVGGQVDVEGGNRGQVNQGDALFGDVSIEYLLDKRAQWRAKAFRRNQFESVIDGQLIVTGIALIFNKEFNEFAELWKRSSQESQKTSSELKPAAEAQLKEEEKE